MATVPAPTNVAVNDKMSASRYNSDVVAADNFFTTNLPSCRLVTTTTPSLTHNVFAVVPFGGESWDTDAMHDNVTNNSRCVFNTAGRYLIVAEVIVTAVAAQFNRVSLNIRKNAAGNVASGTSLATFHSGMSASNFSHSSALTEPFAFVATDYVEIFVNQNNASSLATTLASAVLSAHWIGV